MAELDLGRIKGNVAKMVTQGAPEADIDAYIKGEGTSVDAIRAFTPQAAQATDPSVVGVGPVGGSGTGAAIGRTIANVPSSAAHAATDMVQPILHPVETVQNIGAIGKGVLQKFGIVSGDDAVKYADAVGEFFKERYGSVENIAKTLETDPVGALMDVSTILSGGGTAAARAPGMVGKVGQVAAEAGRVIDPLTAVGKTVKGGGALGAEVIGGMTGTGGKSLRLAAEAGAEGGTAAKTFKENISGAVAPEQIVSEAKSALANIRAERGAEYRAGMAKVGADTTVLDFTKVDAALHKVQDIKNYKGQELSPSTKEIRADLGTTIQEWKNLDPKEFHTAEGLDALKQKIGDIRDAAEPGSPAHLAADQVYNSIRKTIIDQAPEYAKVMKGYEEASTILKEIEKTLSLKNGTSIDTSLRKLQSVLRNDVSANYGQRAVLADYLVSAGAPNLLTALAGQSLNTWLPRGVSKLTAPADILLALHELGSGNPKAAAMVAGALPLTSPKIMGLGAYGAGALTRLPLREGAQGSFQLGRTDRALQ